MDFDDKTVDSSAFNEGMLQIRRLHDSWVRCNHYSVKGMLSDWRWELDVVWRELSFDDKKGDNKFYEKICLLDKALQVAFIRGLRSEMYRLLNEKEVLLRELQHAAGKGGKYVDSTEADFDN